MKNSAAIRFKIPATLSAIDELCARARSWLQENGLEKEWFAITMLLRESLNNAVIHGCREDPAVCIHCELARGRKWLSILVEDGGPGYDWANRRNQRACHEDADGRGLEIYQLYADEVVFNRSGNRVLLRRRLRKGGQGAISSN
jgi:serine/threonine-protein kinase RsbW